MFTDLFMGVVEEAEKKIERFLEFVPKFTSEEKALEHATRIARMQPGARVRIPNKDLFGQVEAVYIAPGDRAGFAQFLVYDPDYCCLKMVIQPWNSIVL